MAQPVHVGLQRRCLIDTLSVDVTGLAQLTRDVNRIGNTALKTEMRAGLRKAGNVVATAAKSNASWSKRIPGSIRVGVTARGVSVHAGGQKAPHAVVFEGRVDGGNRRHPVYAQGERGGWTWAEQQAKPFMRSALNDNVDRVAEVVADTLEKAFTDNGWAP